MSMGNAENRCFLDGEMEEEIDVLGDFIITIGMFHCQIGSDRKPWPGQRFSNMGVIIYPLVN
jgi:hypothetical protein